MRRVGFAGCGLLAGVYSTTGAIGLMATNYSDPIQSEGSGITAMATMAAAWVAAAFLLAALGRLRVISGIDLALRSFGFGWIFGDVINALVATLRGPFPRTQGLSGLVLDVLSVVVVTLILAVPGLAALTLTRFTKREVSG